MGKPLVMLEIREPRDGPPFQIDARLCCGGRAAIQQLSGLFGIEGPGRANSLLPSHLNKEAPRCMLGLAVCRVRRLILRAPRPRQTD
jgi:hypothetical protein